MNKYTFFSRCLKGGTTLFPQSTDGCLSHKLLLYNGLVSPTSNGIFALHPFMLRSLEKLINLVDQSMLTVGGQRLQLPTLGDKKMWVQSNRWNLADGQVFHLKDRTGRSYCLQPTHEEEMTEFLRSFSPSYKDLPVLLYQITTKFRDERRPRYGLIRAREFLMMDMYSFDASKEESLCTYNKVNEAVKRLFSQIRLPFFKVKAHTGDIGGTLSHEFHIPAAIGEDSLLVCDKCRSGYNSEVIRCSHDTQDHSNVAFPGVCTNGDCGGTLNEIRGIEIGHCFLLGQRYSKCFNATYLSPSGHGLFEMGCYGIGMTRLLAASIEHLSSTAFPILEANHISELRWPFRLAPFSGAIAIQKATAKDVLGSEDCAALLDHLAIDTDRTRNLSTQGDILVDDRQGLSLGRKLVDLKRLGIPYILVAKSHPPPYELIDVYTGRSHAAHLDHVTTAFYDPDQLDFHTLPIWEHKRTSEASV